VSTNGQMQAMINGEVRSIPSGQTIEQLLKALGLEGARVAVELDRRIVKPKDWAATEIADGASLEIVQFVGGG
jgi:sulfur carrier protein